MNRRGGAGTARLVIVLAFVTAGLASCILPPSGQNGDLEGQLVASALEAGPGGRIDVADHLAGSPDAAFVILGYSSQASVNEALGFEWPEAGRTGVLDQDGHLLVAIESGKVVEWAFLSMAVDFHLGDEEPYRRVQLGRTLVVESVEPRVVLCPDPCPGIDP